MPQFTIRGMTQEELQWILDQKAKCNFSGSVIMRNLINNKRHIEMNKRPKK